MTMTNAEILLSGRVSIEQFDEDENPIENLVIELKDHKNEMIKALEESNDVDALNDAVVEAITSLSGFSVVSVEVDYDAILF